MNEKRARAAPKLEESRQPHPVTPIHREHIDHLGAWKTTDFESADDYSVDLTPAMQEDIDDALSAARQESLSLDRVERRHFELPSFRPLFEEILYQIRDGRGFVIVRGLPVDRYSKDEIGMLFWGMGTHLGRGLSQNMKGERLGHVRDLSPSDPKARGYTNNVELDIHTDISEIVGLACLRSAKSGGVSQLASALTIHNIILAERPDYLEPLYRGYFYELGGEVRPGEPNLTAHRVPFFSNVDGQISARWSRPVAEAGMAAAGEPLGADDLAILDYLHDVGHRPEVLLEFKLQPGDAYFINNYTIMHARTEFKDYEEEERRRHMLRLWLDVPGMRPVHPQIRWRLDENQEGIHPTASATASPALKKL